MLCPFYQLQPTSNSNVVYLFLSGEDYNLTNREKEILKHLVEGCSYMMIADKCNISVETVKTHFRRIYESSMWPE
jgi:DNA-binding CsgD family transcriptional regulator